MSWYDSNWYSPNYDGNQNNYQPEPPKKSRLPKARRKTRIIALVACVCIIGAGAAAAWHQGGVDSSDGDSSLPNSWKAYFDDYYSSESSESDEINLPTVKERGKLILNFTSSDEVLGFDEIFEKCSPSVVGIKCFTDKEKGSYGWGSGIIVSSNGYILTNTHVIDGGESATVQLYDGTVYDAELVGADAQSDVAILKIDASGLTAASFANSDTVCTGDSVCAIGNPLSPDYSLTITSGIISAASRAVSYNGSEMTLLQTDTSINEGNSGGPLINDRGEVIGITNMKMVSSYSTVEGIGFAIPSNTLRAIVIDLMNHGAVYGRAAIGITVGPVPEDIASYYEIPTGLYVAEVRKNSDAEKQGIKKGDIITEVNGEAVTKTSDVSDAKESLSVGESISFTIWRDGKTFEVSVKLVDSIDLD